MNKIEEILKKININIPNPPKPVGNYAAFNKSEKLIFISGQLPITVDGKIITGKVMKEVTLEQAQKAAEISILNALGQLKNACNGDLNKVKSCIRISGYVNCLDNFSKSHEFSPLSIAYNFLSNKEQIFNLSKLLRSYEIINGKRFTYREIFSLIAHLFYHSKEQSEKFKKIIDITENLKHKTITTTIYSCGLRLSELLELASRKENKDVFLNLEVKSTPFKMGLTPMPSDTVSLILKDIDDLIIGSLGIVAFISFFVGGVITIQTALNIDNPLIPKYLVGFATRQSVILEFAPTFISIIMAGKVGSYITSSIGTMRVTEQIDALEVMGINTYNYLIFPKIVALSLYPLIISLSMFLGIFGGYIACVYGGFSSSTEFIEGIQTDFIPFHVTYAFIKTFFFSFIFILVQVFSLQK
mgnify:CR=1 FL=1